MKCFKDNLHSLERAEKVVMVYFTYILHSLERIEEVVLVYFRDITCVRLRSPRKWSLYISRTSLMHA
jgi:hypothetical protein